MNIHQKMLRSIDVALLRSIIAQFFYLFIIVVFVLGVLLVIQIPFESVTMENVILSFINNSVDAGKEKEILLMVTNLLSKILIGGVLISVIVNMLLRRIERLQNGQVYYRFRKHVVVIGYDRLANGLIRQLSARYPETDLVLQTMQEAPKVRGELFPKLTADMERRVTIVVGNRNEYEDLRKLCLDRTQALFVLGESDEPNRDSLNIESLKKINKLLADKKAEPDKPCYVLFENQSAYAVLQQQDLNELRIEKTRQNGRTETITYLKFYPFNIDGIWAQKLFADCRYEYREDDLKAVEYLPLDRAGIDCNSNHTVHLVVLGMSKMGVALGIQASHLCHFPNFLRDNRLKTRITFIDEDADREMHYLQSRYRYFFEETDCTAENMEQPDKRPGKIFTDIRWHFIKGRIEHPDIQERLKRYADEKDTLLTIAVCLNVPEKAIACGLYLPDEVYRSDAQILVKQDTPYSILSMLRTNGKDPYNKYRNVKPFGMLEYALDLSKNDDLPSMTVNYVYDYYYNHQKMPTFIPPVSELEKSWKKLKTVKKWSNRYHAAMLAVKQRSFGLQTGFIPDEATIQQLAEVEHNRWNVEELLLGYRPATEEEKRQIGSNPALKEKLKKAYIHKDIGPYADIADMDLSESNKIKNTREYDICLSKTLPLMLEYIGRNRQ